MPSSNTPLLNLSLLIDVTFSTPTGDYTHNPGLARSWCNGDVNASHRDGCVRFGYAEGA